LNAKQEKASEFINLILDSSVIIIEGVKFSSPLNEQSDLMFIRHENSSLYKMFLFEKPGSL